MLIAHKTITTITARTMMVDVLMVTLPSARPACSAAARKTIAAKRGIREQGSPCGSPGRDAHIGVPDRAVKVSFRSVSRSAAGSFTTPLATERRHRCRSIIAVFRRARPAAIRSIWPNARLPSVRFTQPMATSAPSRPTTNSPATSPKSNALPRRCAGPSRRSKCGAIPAATRAPTIRRPRLPPTRPARSGCSSACYGCRRRWSPSAPSPRSRGWRGDLILRAIAGEEKSIRVRVCRRRQHRAHDDFQIQPQRPVVDVEQVVLDALAHLVFGVDGAAEAVDLGPAGDARLDVVAAAREADALLVFAVVRQRVRPRPDQRHVADQHVEQLRDLVDVPAPPPAADAGQPRIVALRLRYHGAVVERAHGAEFEDAERLLVEAKAALQEKHRARAVEPDQHGDDDKERRQRQQPQCREREVE